MAVAVAAGYAASEAMNVTMDAIKATIQNLKIEDFRLGRPQDLANNLGKKYTLATQLAAKDIGQIADAIKAAIADDFDHVLGFMKEGNLAGAGGMYATLWDLFNGSSNLLNNYNSIVQSEGINPYIKRWVNSQLLYQIPDAQKMAELSTKWLASDGEFKEIFRYHGIAEHWAEAYREAQYSYPSIGALNELVWKGKITRDTWGLWMLRQGYRWDVVNTLYGLTEQMPEPYRIADMAAKELASDGELKQAFSWVGLSPHWAEMWREAQYVYPSIQALNELLWRGKIDRTNWGLWLLRQGYKGEVVNTMFGLTESLPSSNDLVTMVVREAFEESNITPAPPVFAGEMVKKGFNQYWSDKYWTAHWLPMPVNLAYANLHRGFWTKDQFMELLRIADYHPRWREAIYNVAYNPPSIREMGYGYDVGAYTKEEIIKYRRWGGLSEVDANKAGQAMVAYRTEAEREAVRREYLYLYVLDKFDSDTFREALASIGTAPEAIPLWIERGDFQKIRKETEAALNEPRTLTRADAQWLFEKGLRDEQWLIGILDNLSYDNESIEAYVDQSKQRMKDKIVVVEPKQLTLAMIHDLYHYKKISEADMVIRIIELGYSEADAVDISQAIVEEELAAVKPVKYNELSRSDLADLWQFGYIKYADVVNRLVAYGYNEQDANFVGTLIRISVVYGNLKALYSKGWINSKDMFDELIRTGLSKVAVDNLMMITIKYTGAERTTVERDLTKAEIVKGVKNLVLTPIEGIQLLQNLGYDAGEAEYILIINKVLTAGDPEGYWDMRRATEAYKKARGEKYVNIPTELVLLEAQRKQLQSEVIRLKESKATEEQIGLVAVQLASAQANMQKIIATLKLS